MAKALRAAAMGAVLVLSACGGGGGGGGGADGGGTIAGGGAASQAGAITTAPASAVPAPVQAFQLRNLWANDFGDTTPHQFTLSGTINGASVAGSGALTRGPVSSATFEGASALSKTTTISGAATANGQTSLIYSVGTMYVDSNYNPLGGSNGTEYGVVTGPVNIPQTAKVGDTAVLFTMNLYADSAKTTAIGTRTYSYALEPDTASTALFKYTTVQKDASNAAISTDTLVMRITPAGDRTYVSEISIAPGQNLTLSY